MLTHQEAEHECNFWRWGAPQGVGTSSRAPLTAASQGLSYKTMVLQKYLSRSIPCPQSGYSVRYILAKLAEICSFRTRPSHSQCADHPHRAAGRVIERSDIAKRWLRMVRGAIGLRRARVPPHSTLIWRPLASAEAASPLPSDVSGLPPYTHSILTLLSFASFASPRGRHERCGRAERLKVSTAHNASTLHEARHPSISRVCRCLSVAAPMSSAH